MFFPVGKPIAVNKIVNPTYEEIEALQSIYIDELKKLFEENKSKYEKNVNITLTIN